MDRQYQCFWADWILRLFFAASSRGPNHRQFLGIFSDACSRPRFGFPAPLTQVVRKPPRLTKMVTRRAALGRLSRTGILANAYSIRCMARKRCGPQYVTAGETRNCRESLLQNTKGWARPFTSSPALLFLPSRAT